MMHGREKSDSAIVAVKPANKVERSAAEPVEPRAETKGNADQQRTRRTQSRISVSQLLARIRQALAVWTRGRSRMRESRTYGSVRGREATRVQSGLHLECAGRSRATTSPRHAARAPVRPDTGSRHPRHSRRSSDAHVWQGPSGEFF
jgi:hypothetical protein